MKKLFFLILLILMTCGCVSYTELNELGIISAVGIDYQDNKYYLTTNFILPQKDDGESSFEVELFESNAASLEDAFQKIYLKSNKRIYLSHVELVAISENVAKEKLREVTNFFLQTEQSRNAFPLVILKDASLVDLLKLQDAPDTIEHLLEINREEYGTTFLLSMEDFARMLLEQNSGVIPTLTIDEVPTTLGLAMIQDKKLTGYLTLEESNAYLFLTNKIEQMKFSVPCGENNTEITLLENTTLLSNKKNKITINLQSKIQGNTNFCKESLNQLYEKEIGRKIDLLLDKTQYRNLDLLQFTDYIYRNDYFYYKLQKDLFNSLTYEVKFQTEVLDHSSKTKGELS